ncbi:MAG: hypothetical protein WBL05_08545 [Brooklawnia sp.]|uniref:hypothetical protein n=1 Tax=Brooklawnia sp. TaxID=2699740 RepID=UPI003C749FB5
MNKVVPTAVLPLLGLSLLAGCAPTGGTAAIVNGVVLPDSRVIEASEACADALRANGAQNAEPGAIRREMLEWVVMDEMGKQYVDSQPTKPTEDELRAEAAALNLQPLLQNERCAEITLGVARYNLVASSLGSNWSDAFGDFEVELNPRYGTWDLSNVSAVGSGSLSQLDENYRPAT